MKDRVHGLDWSRTPLGPVADWPAPLKTAVSIMLESPAQVAMFVGPEFVALYNDAYAPSIGAKHPASLGRPARETWGDELWSDLGPMLKEVLTTGRPIAQRDHPFHLDRNGFPETVYVDISYSPVRDGETILAVLCIVSETTGRVRAETRMRQNEEQLRMLFSQAQAGFAVSEPSGRLVMVNERFCELTGYAQEELIGQRLEQLVDTDDFLRGQHHHRQLIRAGKSYSVEERLTRKDGSPVWVQRSTGPILDLEGKISQISSIVTDITERRRAEVHGRRLAAIIASSGDAILSTDLEMRITSWNAGAERLYGYTVEEAVGMPVTILVPPDRAAEEPAIIARIRTGKQVETHETLRQHKSGRPIEVSLTVSPVFNEYGQVVGASKIARDITERRNAERMQKILLGEMKHRVKNILATVHAIARQSFQKLRAPEVDVFNARLQSLSRAQDLITREARDGAELSALIDEVIAPYHPERFRIIGPRLLLSGRAALSFTLGLHELATNAAKYGALASPGGAVELEWRLVGAAFEMTWRETGGAAVAPPKRRGYGSLLIENVMASEMNGRVTLEYLPEGLFCRLTAPVEQDWIQPG